MFLKPKYRVNRDRYYPSYWAVNYKTWYWPFWKEHGNGLLPSKESAEELIKTLKKYD